MPLPIVPSHKTHVFIASVRTPTLELKPGVGVEAGPCKWPGDKQGPSQWLGDQPYELTVTGRDFPTGAQVQLQFEDDGAASAVAAANAKLGRKDEVLNLHPGPAQAQADAQGKFTVTFPASRRSRGDYRLHVNSGKNDLVAVFRVVPDDRTDTDAQRQQRFTSFVREATRKLRDSYFGTWQGYELDQWGEPTIPDFSKDQFDKEFWEWVGDDKYSRVLRSRSGKSPAEAIDAVFDRLSAWRFDCDHTVQIANFYAMRMTYGAALFNHREGSQILFRPRESTGLIPRLHYGRQGPSEGWRIIHYFMPPDKFVFSPGYALPLETKQLLSIAPAGSRVRWTNRAAPSHSAFRHENGVKLADDLYATGGIDDPITGNEFRQEALEIRLALMTTPKPTWTYIHENVYIDEIEILDW
jgi:Protein-glutamine gamma-glutamyltransferase